MADLDQPDSFWTRIKRALHFGGEGDSLLPAPPADMPHGISFFRRFSRRDLALENLQRSFDTMTQMLITIRQDLDQQAHQHQEVSQRLAELAAPAAIFPEGIHAPDDAVRAIAQQLAYQGQQQNRVGNILEKLSDSSTEQGRLLQSLVERTEMLEHHHQLASENLQSVGIAMQSVSRNSDQNAQAIQNLRDQAEQRDLQWQYVIGSQSRRLTALLLVSLALAIASLVLLIVVMAMIHSRNKAMAPANPRTLSMLGGT